MSRSSCLTCDSTRLRSGLLTNPFRVRHDLATSGFCEMQVVVETIPGRILPLKRAEAIAVVDTGSAGTVIRRDLVEALGLVEIGVAEVTHAAHAQPVPCAYTAAHVVLAGEGGGVWTFEERLLVAEHEDMAPGLILGLDCFAQGVLTVNQVENWWSFVAFG